MTAKVVYIRVHYH